MNKKIGSVGEWNAPIVRYFSDIVTCRAGGYIRFFKEIEDERELISFVKSLDKDEQIFIIGEGSNIIPSEYVFDGIVVRYTGSNCSIANGVLEVQAGASLNKLVQFLTTKTNYSAFEQLAGIPGTVGAAVVQNSGAYGREISDLLISARIYDVELDKIITIEHESFEYEYRNSKLKREQRILFSNESDMKRINHIVLSAKFTVVNKILPVEYDGLKAMLPKNFTTDIIRKKVLELRKSKGTLFNLRDPETFGCGSFFKNPIIKEKKAKELGLKGYVFSKNYVKVSAAKVLELAGYKKGYTSKLTNVKISKYHILSIVNTGYDSADDIIDFAGRIISNVRKKLKISLELEPTLIFTSRYENKKV
jgi:UDP-N-acetylmuramate dehydrogenase